MASDDDKNHVKIAPWKRGEDWYVYIQDFKISCAAQGIKMNKIESLKANKLCKSYGKRNVVNNVDIEVKKGEGWMPS